MSQNAKRLDDLENFLISNEEQSKSETAAELRSQGVDTERFFNKIHAIVQAGYCQQLRVIAQREQAALKAQPPFLENLATMTREAMLAIFSQLRDGAFGSDYQEAALARCRNKDASSLSDGELRSWLEDVGDIFGCHIDEK